MFGTERTIILMKKNEIKSFLLIGVESQISSYEKKKDFGVMKKDFENLI